MRATIQLPLHAPATSNDETASEPGTSVAGRSGVRLRSWRRSRNSKSRITSSQLQFDAEQQIACVRVRGITATIAVHVIDAVVAGVDRVVARAAADGVVVASIAGVEVIAAALAEE